jgi:DNA (cytosine-5)-methyltransferase 1
LLENVEGFARNGGLKFISEGLAAINARAGTSYRVRDRLLNAAEFGVPQMRRRYFIVALRSGVDFEFPIPTHGPGARSFVTPWAAFKGLEPPDESLTPRGRWADLLPSIPEGKNYLWHTLRGGGQRLFGWRTRYWSFLFKLARDKPSPTIVASPSQNTGPYHWENRLLSTAELARLQAFPLGYTFCGDRASRQRQIGNAVPPLLAEHLGRELMVTLGGKPPKILRYDIPNEISNTSDTPEQSEISTVPQKYHCFIGDHPDHPGTGRGPKGSKTRSRQHQEAV